MSFSTQCLTLSELVGPRGLIADGDWIESKDQDPDGEVRLVQLADIGEGQFIDKSSRFLTTSTATSLRCTYLKAGDLLIARMPDPIGRACIFPENQRPSVTAVDVCIVRPDGMQVNTKWLMHALNSQVIRKEIEKGATGTTRSRISTGKLKNLEFNVPSLEEQKRIAAILDKADSLRRKRQQAIRLADDFLQAVFLDMFGDPESNPKHWPTTRLDQISLQITDGEHQTPQRSNEGVYLLSARNVQDGRLDFGDVDYVPHAEYERIRKRCEPVRGDVLISCSGSIGRVAQVDVDVPLTLVRSVALVRPDPTKVRSGFLEHLLRTPSLQRAMQKASKSSAQANLFQAPIRTLTAILPPISLQDNFEQVRLSTLKARKKIAESSDEHQAFCAAIQNTYF